MRLLGEKDAQRVEGVWEAVPLGEGQEAFACSPISAPTHNSSDRALNGDLCAPWDHNANL